MKPHQVYDRLGQLDDSHPVIASFLAGIGVLAIDFITGKHIEFPILYAIPVGMAAWKKKGTALVMLSVILPLVRVLFHFPWKETYALTLTLLNSPVTMLSLLFYGYLIRRTSIQTEKLESKLKILEGILPICASCKRIRNAKGEYEQVEQYITDRSEAQFSHTICPACAQRLYPDFYPKKQ